MDPVLMKKPRTELRNVRHMRAAGHLGRMRRVLDTVFLAILVAILSFVCYSSWCRWRNEEKLVIVKQEAAGRFKLPNVIICPAWTNVTNPTDFEAVLEQVETPYITRVEQYNALLVKDMKVVRNDFTLNDIMYDAVVQDTFFGGYLHCKVFRPPLDAKVGVSPDKTFNVELKMQKKPSFFYFTIVCLEGNFLPSYNVLFGCQYRTISTTVGNAEKISLGVDITRILHRKKPTKHERCLEDHEVVKIDDCITDSIERQIGCKLPWGKPTTSGPENLCEGEEQFEKYRNAVLPIKDATERSIEREFNCVQRCNTESYQLDVAWSYKNNSDNNLDYADTLLDLQFHVRKPSVEVQEENLLYDGSNFLADVGGFLGLLLGMSCYSGINAMMQVASKHFRCLRSTKA